ncbi:hypothetical protein J6590_035727 [Homalodisca vitripennis]|nr:hypothetical protein J6590_035727 [Homalodisca vitripennis]
MLNNMKSRIKKKTDLKATGNKPIKLSKWEVQFLESLNEKENPVFCKVPGNTAVGVSAATNMDMCNEKPGPSLQQIPTTNKGKEMSEKISKSTKKVLEYENDQTRELSTPQLQRIVLLQQMKLNEMKLEREKIKLDDCRKNNFVVNLHKLLQIFVVM